MVQLQERCTDCTPVRVRDNLQHVHSFHAVVFKICDVRNEVQFSVKDEAKEFESIIDMYGNAIQSKLWVCMQSVLLSKMHADGFSLKKQN